MCQALGRPCKVLRPPDLWPSWHSQCSQLLWLFRRPAGEGQEGSPSRQCYLPPMLPIREGLPLCGQSWGAWLWLLSPDGSPVLSPLCRWHPAWWTLVFCLPVVWILEVTVGVTQGQVSFCD